MMSPYQIRLEICKADAVIIELNKHIGRCRKPESIRRGEAKRDNMIAIRRHYINKLKEMGEWGK